MIPVNLSANCEGYIYDPSGSGIQISESIFELHGLGHVCNEGRQDGAD